MQPGTIPANEAARLATLRHDDILDTSAESEFDDFARLAAQICGAPMSIISRVDEGRQWFMSNIGVDACVTPGFIAFAGHVIHGKDIFEVPNALEDVRFRDNPLVAGAPDIRFYAGVPLITPAGQTVGTLSVIDRLPRQLASAQRDALVSLGRLVVQQLELRLAIRRLAEKAALQQALLSNAGGAIIATTPEGVITHFNPEAERMLGYAAAEIVGRLTLAVFHDPQEVVAVAKDLSRELGREIEGGFEVLVAKARDGEIDAREWSYLRKDGARCPVLLSVIALRDETGKISGFLACANDLTARYRAKVELSEAEARYRSLVELSPDALIVHANGIIDYVNPSAVRLFAAKSAGQMIGIHLLDLMHPESRPEVKARIESIMNGIEVALYAMRRILCFDGAVRTVEMASLGFNQGGRRLAQVIVRDNTERASAEKQLRASETRYRMLIENVFDAIFMHDQGIFTYVNPAAVALFGAQSAQALIGQNYLDWVHPDEREESRLRMRAHLEGTNTVKHVIRRIVRPSGEIRFVSAGLISVEDNGRQLLLGMVQDITERQRAEEQIHILNVSLEQRVQERTAELEHSLEQLSQTQVQLVRFEKMAALGGMVAGIAHEINTPVGISVTAAAHLGMKVNDLAERYHAGSLSRSDMAAFIDSASESSQMVLSNLRRAADLIGSFKLVAVDQSDGHRRLFNLKSYIEDVLVSLNPHLGRTGHTVRLLCPEALELYGHPGSFSQIVTNLVLNSLRHGFEGKDAGNIAIEVDEKNDGLRLHYSDDGCGIAVEHLDRIFDPFYTTKRGAGGSGLGLHIVYNIVTQGLGGHITVCNNPDKGVSFDLNIPRSAMMLPDALHPGRAGKMAAG